MMNEVHCPSCGEIYKIEGVFFGKICIKCGIFIESDNDLEIIKKNKENRTRDTKKAIESVRRQMNGSNHGNK
jgi:uncharacterized protein (DUF2225 family)